MRILPSSVLALFSLLISAHSAQAIIIANFTSATNDRFANDGAFIGVGFDWSGVGLNSSGKWGTLVGSNVFLSANHSHPAVSSSLTFYATNDPSGASITRTVSSGQRIGSTDLWIGVLDSPVSASYTSYAFVSNDIANATAFGPSPVNGLLGYSVGKSATGWSSLLDVAVGENVLDLWAEDSDAGGTIDDALASLAGYANDVTYETLLQSGDSGGPLFVNVDGSLVLIGINWWVGEAVISTITYDVSGYSYLGNYDTEITSFISANAVPEPGVFALFAGLVALGGACCHRRRRSSTG